MKVRKQVYIEREQEVLLKRMAERLQVSEADLIRRALDASLRSLNTVPPDQQAWEEEKKFIRDLIAKGPVEGKRTWKREELHER